MEEDASRLEVVRTRLKDGRTIADIDVHWLVAHIDALKAEIDLLLLDLAESKKA